MSNPRIKCGSITRIATNAKKGMIIYAPMECHRRDCPHCEGRRVEKYLAIMSTPLGPMQLYSKELLYTLAKSIARSARHDGEFYWLCPLKNGNAVLVTTDNRRLQGEGIEPHDLPHLVAHWMQHQSTDLDISHTRGTAKTKDTDDKWKVYTSALDRKSMKTITGEVYNWREVKRGLFVTPSSGSFGTVEEVLDMARNDFHYMVVPVKCHK